MNDVIDTSRTHARDRDFPVIGIGASAGGIGPLKEFFEALPDDPGMAFVVIVHLARGRQSHLAGVVGRHTNLPTEQVTGNTGVRPNHVFVIPPDRNISIEDGILHLSELEESSGNRMPIDHFLRTLARDRTERAAGVIFSGTGSDGTLGLQRIKEAGGLTLAQAPETSEYSDMPRSAIATGHVDAVLEPHQLGKQLTSYFNRQLSTTDKTVDMLSAPEARALEKILSAVRSRTDHDFSQYKRSSILRRTLRRMRICGTESLPAYHTYLQDHPAEARKLAKDFLISVTNFFRTPEAFEALEATLIPELFSGCNPGENLRIWVPGCATGEEAYSLAILLHEEASRLTSPPEIQVFASDIDTDALSVARQGVYSEAIAGDISAERLGRFFREEEAGFVVAPDIRGLITFAEHNLLQDPPFSNLDLVTCRNLLIYLGRPVQETVFELFHFALRPEGYLMLGTSESAEGASDLFSTVDKEHSIYQRRPVDSARLEAPVLPLMNSVIERTPGIEKNTTSGESGFGPLHQQLIARRWAPPSAIVDENYNIVHLAGGFGRYLRETDGAPSRKLLEKLPADLRANVRRAFRHAAEHGTSRRTEKIRRGTNEPAQTIRMRVEAIQDPEGFFLVAFEEIDSSREEDTVAAPERQDGEEPIVERLEAELQRTKEELRHTVVDYETSMEELKSSNEELQSMNEELQSTTEELETSKEEHQSINEELTTVNEKLSDKIDQLSRANSDLNNLIKATEIGSIFVDDSLRVQRFTEPVVELFNLRPADLGRPLPEVTHKLEVDNLADEIERTVEHLEKIRREVAAENGRWYIMRIRPYRTLDDKIEGAVLTFVDITRRKEAEEALQSSHDRLEEQVEHQTTELRESNARLQAIVKAMPDVMLRVASDRTVMDVEGAGRTGLLEPGQNYQGKTLKEIFSASLAEQLAEGIDYAVASNTIQTVHFGHGRQDADRREFEVRIAPIEGSAALIIIRDVTERQHMEREILRISEQERQMIGRELHDGLGQVFTGLSMMSRSLIDELEDRESDMAGKARELYELIREADELSHRVLEGMGSVLLGEDTLEIALHRLAQQMEDLFEVSIRIDAPEQVPVYDDVTGTHLFRIAQEAAVNSIKHGDASAVTLRVQMEDNNIRLEVIDNGSGLSEDFDMETQAGLGLRHIMHRTRLMDGTVRLRPATDGGAVFICEVPQRRPAGE